MRCMVKGWWKPWTILCTRERKRKRWSGWVGSHVGCSSLPPEHVLSFPQNMFLFFQIKKNMFFASPEHGTTDDLNWWYSHSPNYYFPVSNGIFGSERTSSFVMLFLFFREKKTFYLLRVDLLFKFWNRICCRTEVNIH